MGPAFLDGFVIVFAVIGGLELVDRTSFALIALATRNRPLATWAGGACGFVLTTGLAVLIGAALETALGPGRIELVRVGGGVFLLGYAAWLWTRRGSSNGTAVALARGPAFAAAFLTIFLLELGDTTMVFEIVFVTSFGWEVVLLAGALALVAVAAWDVKLGQRLAGWIEAAHLEKLVVVVLALVGALTIAYGLAPSTFAALAARL
ncbi:MAG TPA: TMEM165/GDT1 family protein [Thermoplasmata archaeon]|nr:TMEM165/GDT1 family protein [Thermoplasmata archaeon]